MRPERDFTPPSAFCPHPERWTAIDADSAEREVTELVASLVRALQPDYAIATGAGFGHTAQAIGTALRRNGHGRLAAIEFDEARAAEAEERCQQLPVKVWCQDSLAFVPEEPVEFAWLDSASCDRERELRRLLQWMPAGAIAAVHDAGTQRDVYRMLQSVAVDGIVRAVRLRTPRGVLILEAMADGIRSAR